MWRCDDGLCTVRELIERAADVLVIFITENKSNKFVIKNKMLSIYATSKGISEFVANWNRKYKRLLVGFVDVCIVRLCDLADDIYAYEDRFNQYPCAKRCVIHYSTSTMPKYVSGNKYVVMGTNNNSDLSMYPKIQLHNNISLRGYRGTVKKAIFQYMLFPSNLKCKFEEIIITDVINANNIGDFETDFADFLNTINTEIITVSIRNIDRNIIRNLTILDDVRIRVYNIAVNGKLVRIANLDEAINRKINTKSARTHY